MNMMKSVPLLAAVAALSLTSIANAQVVLKPRGVPIIASYHSRGMCLDVRASDNTVLLWPCHGGDNQAFRFVSGNYGLISLGNNQCLTGGSSRGQNLTAQPCNNRDQRQKWGFQDDGSLRNETGLCADVHSGRRDAGAPIISWNCNSGASNQRWYPGVTTDKVNLGVQGLAALARGPIQGLIASNGFSSGNMVAAGGGNMVAAGGGNMVAAGGGNIVLGGAGSIIAAGGGNMVAAGGGNVVPTGGGSLLPNNWSFFNNSGFGNLVGNDGASLMPR